MSAADSFWTYVESMGQMVSEEEVVKYAPDNNPWDAPADLCYGEVQGNRWIAMRFCRQAALHDVRVVMIVEGNEGWTVHEEQYLMMTPTGGGKDVPTEIIDPPLEPIFVDVFGIVDEKVTDAAYAALRGVIHGKSVRGSDDQLYLFAEKAKKLIGPAGSFIGYVAKGFPEMVGKLSYVQWPGNSAAVNVAWTLQAPIQDNFAHLILEEVPTCHLDRNHFVIIGQTASMVTALFAHDGTWHILAGRTSDPLAADPLVSRPDSPPKKEETEPSGRGS